MESEAVWEPLKVDSDFEICTEYPYQIRRKDNGYIIAEWEGNNGYIRVKLNDNYYYKHVVVAHQWIENDDPENNVEIDHRNRDRSDNHVENLRWVSRSMNLFNRTGWGKYKYEYVDDMPVDATPIILYRGVEFEGYFMTPDGDVWFYNGEQYRKVRVYGDNYVQLWDINHRRHSIGVKRLRREFQS